MRRLTVMLAATLVVVAACAGGSAADSVSPDATAAPSNDGSSEDGPTTTDGVANNESPGGDTPVSGLGKASLTINGETYLFGETSFPSLRCDPDNLGTF